MESHSNKDNITQDPNSIEVIAPFTSIDVEMAAVPAKHDDPYLVAFEEPFDAENPKY
jgi:hypothetical protein